MVFHGLWLVSMVFQGGFMFFMVFGWFPWFFKVVSMVFHGFWLVFMVFQGGFGRLNPVLRQNVPD